MQFTFLQPSGDPDSVWRIIGRLFAEAGRKYARGYTVATLFMIFVAATTALSAWIIKDVVDQVFVDRQMDQLIILAIAVAVISIARGASLYGSTVTLSRVGNAIVSDMQKRLYDHILSLGLNYYDRQHSSELIAAMSLKANSTRQVLDTVMTSFGRDLLSVVGLVIVMVIQSPWMSLIALVVGPIAILGVGRLIKRIREIAGMEYQGNSMIISAMQETAAGIRIIKAFNLESAMRARMAESIDAVRRRANKVASIRARTSPLMETLGGFAIAAVMLWAGYATIYNGEKPGAFMSFMTALLFAYEPAKRLANTRVQLERGVVGVRMIYKILDTKPTMETNPDGPDLKIERGEVVFRNVSFSYRKSTPVLRQLDFRAAPGKLTALVGPSGSGKSTIISLIERFYDLGAGAIAIDGQDIATVRLASLRDQVALVSQDTVMFRASIRDNIRFGRPSATDEEVEEAAKSAMAHGFIMAQKEGYDTMLEDGATQLSGGQRQRIAIARAMLREARVILLDEATSSLDSESEHQVQVAFDHLMAGRTTIVIAHRLSTVLGADRICVVVDGRIVESGRHADLLALGNHYARLYHLQFERHAANDADLPDPKVASVG